MSKLTFWLCALVACAVFWFAVGAAALRAWGDDCCGGGQPPEIPQTQCCKSITVYCYDYPYGWKPITGWGCVTCQVWDDVGHDVPQEDRCEIVWEDSWVDRSVDPCEVHVAVKCGDCCYRGGPPRKPRTLGEYLGGMLLEAIQESEW